MSIDTDKYGKLLQDRLGELDKRLGQIDANLDAEVPKDFEDRATEREDDEALEDLGESAVDEVRAIRAALDRIEQGTYGECVSCGVEILSERLDIVPHAPLCRTCARAA